MTIDTNMHSTLGLCIVCKSNMARGRGHVEYSSRTRTHISSNSICPPDHTSPTHVDKHSIVAVEHLQQQYGVYSVLISYIPALHH